VTVSIIGIRSGQESAAWGRGPAGRPAPGRPALAPPPQHAYRYRFDHCRNRTWRSRHSRSDGCGNLSRVVRRSSHPRSAKAVSFTRW